jgi:hypothetical protein
MEQGYGMDGWDVEGGFGCFWRGDLRHFFPVWWNGVFVGDIAKCGAINVVFLWSIVVQMW